MPRLSNKIALVTGAARGIGAAVSELFVREGATVILSDIRDDAGVMLADRLGDSACYRHLDVREVADWEAAATHITETHGRLDVLVNNAGITGLVETPGPHDPEHLDMESWSAVHRTNMDGVALGCKFAIRLMKSSPAASIVNISSRSGLVGIPAAAAYASSKAAVRNHSKSVALHCAEKAYPIRCNSIHPGAILTPMWDPILGKDAAREKALQAIAADVPMGRLGEPMDVAWATLYLASDESIYVTGIELNVDGGILAGSKAAPSTE